MVEFLPSAGTMLRVGDRHHAGELRVAAHGNGLALSERLTVDDYLLGIREVPFSWPQQALQAQAVAARTYLAWTLDRGRSEAATRYGYDICATTACQVYAGMDAVLGPGGDAWRWAVDETADEILVHEGRPAQALYSSTTGGRTRNVEDVFVGAVPSPYLRGVESPGEDSPFASWSYLIPPEEMSAMLVEAGLLEGGLLSVRTKQTVDGGGPWQVIVEGTEGTTATPTWRFRTLLNRAATALYPDDYPVWRPDGSGRRYPQVVMSPTFTIEPANQLLLTGSGAPDVRQTYRVEGRGWGHLVGMSQYGAEAMARQGASHEEILAHFYGGLRPQPSGGLLPSSVVVGLEVGQQELTVAPTGPVTVLVDGLVVAQDVLGSWRMTWSGERVVATPSPGVGTPPRLGLRVVHSASSGPETVHVGTSAPAEVRLVARIDDLVVFDSGWLLTDAGELSWSWRQAGGGLPAGNPVTLTATARSPQGGDTAALRVVGGAE